MKYMNESFMTPEAVAIVMKLAPNMPIRKAQEIYVKSVESVLADHEVFHIYDIEWGAGPSLVKRYFELRLRYELRKEQIENKEKNK